MFLRIENIPKTILIGHSKTMSFMEDSTRELWQGFMPHRNEVPQRIGDEFYSLQVYDQVFDFEDFRPNTMFKKYALVASSSSLNKIPEDMEAIEISGLYAVFLHRGTPATFQKTFQYIFTDWLPKSGYEIEHRPHFEKLGDKYDPTDPNSEEEVYIPIVKR